MDTCAARGSRRHKAGECAAQKKYKRKNKTRVSMRGEGEFRDLSDCHGGLCHLEEDVPVVAERETLPPRTVVTRAHCTHGEIPRGFTLKTMLEAIDDDSREKDQTSTDLSR